MKRWVKVVLVSPIMVVGAALSAFAAGIAVSFFAFFLVLAFSAIFGFDMRVVFDHPWAEPILNVFMVIVFVVLFFTGCIMAGWGDKIEEAVK